MTLSTDSTEQAASSSAMPGINADGHVTWSPSVGRYHKPASGKRESFGGIIGAAQDAVKASGANPKSYPENFAGIIAALQDLRIGEYQPGSDTGPKPPGDEIDNTDPDNPIYHPGKHVTGQLWFDTRQGRLFVWTEANEWVQTNGADALPIMSDDMPSIDNLVPGQFWYDTDDDILYIFDGSFITTAGTLEVAPTATNVPVWKPIAGEGVNDLQDTATLPLAYVGPKVATVSGDSYLPDIDLLETMHTQKDYNEWLFASLNLLDEGLSSFQSVVVSEDAPDEPDEGQLWFDTERLDLSIWYDDGSTQQWVPTSTAYSYEADMTALSAELGAETRLREKQYHALNNKINAFDLADNNEIIRLQQDVNAVNHRINVLPTYNLSAYANKADVISDLQAVINRINTLENNPTDLSGYQTKAQASAESSILSGLINQKASISELNTVKSSIPNVGLFVTQADIDNSINNITTEYLPRSGGRLTGSFTLSKADVTLPGIDFSETTGSGMNAIKFATYSPDETSYTTLGTTDNLWECAWKFNNEEDFCWIYNDTNKVFSITKDGPACSSLVLGDFGNNTANGRVIMNKIDVKQRLTSYQSAFEEIRQGVSNSTDFESLKSSILSALANV